MFPLNPFTVTLTYSR